MKPWLIPACLSASVFVAFHPAVFCGFVNWDDDRNILFNTEFRGFSWTHLRWMFTAVHEGHYHPLTWLTFAADHAVWGLWAPGYHLTNLLIHAASAAVLFHVMLALLGRSDEGARACAGIAAWLWAVHPLRVESVVWVTERRGVLSALLLLSAVLLYVRYARRPSSGGYVAALVCYALALLAKGTGMTLWAVLVVLDVFPLRRALTGRVVLEKIPFMALAAGGAVLAYLAARQSASFVPAEFSLAQRAANAGYALVWYPLRTLAPLGLCPLYLLDWNLRATDLRYVVSWVMLAVAGVATLARRRAWPGVLVAALCYLITVSPQLGLTQAGRQAMADRYAHLSTIAWFVLLAAGLLRLSDTRPHWRRPVVLVAGMLVAVAGGLASRQSRFWKDSVTLWSRALEIDPRNTVAWSNRGYAKLDAEEFATALADFDRALEIDPRYGAAHGGRGAVLAATGDHGEALRSLNRALAADPRRRGVHALRGSVRLELGDARGAIADFDAALELDPRDVAAKVNRALAMAAAGRAAEALADLAEVSTPGTEEAVFTARAIVKRRMGDARGARDDLDAAIRMSPRSARPRLMRAEERLAEGDLRGAVEDYDVCLAARSTPAAAWMKRGVARFQLGDREGGLADLDEAIRRAPGLLEAYVNRGSVRKALGQYAGAVADFEHALRAAPADWPQRRGVEEVLADARRLAGQ